MGTNTLEEAKKHRYGVWRGNPKGYAYDPLRCAEQVWPSGEWTSRQCGRKRTESSIFCKQHTPKSNQGKL